MEEQVEIALGEQQGQPLVILPDDRAQSPRLAAVIQGFGMGENVVLVTRQLGGGDGCRGRPVGVQFVKEAVPPVFVEALLVLVQEGMRELADRRKGLAFAVAVIRQGIDAELPDHPGIQRQLMDEGIGHGSGGFTSALERRRTGGFGWACHDDFPYCAWAAFCFSMAAAMSGAFSRSPSKSSLPS